MADAPRFLAPDNVLRSEYIFTTTQATRFFTGTMDADTVDMQVSIRGAGFVSDPSLISFEGAQFTIPNPSAFPDGVQLFPGLNRIEVKSVLTNGSSTTTSFIEAHLSQDSDIGVQILAPTGISLERFDGVVTVTVEGVLDTNVIGYNFWASTQPGGSIEGYSRVNVSLVISGIVDQETTSLGTLEVDSTKSTTPDGRSSSDPLYLALRGTQQDRAGNVFTTDFNEALVIPDTVGTYRTTVSVVAVRTRTSYSFTHDRQATFNSANNPAIPNAVFNTIPSVDPLYYVVSAVYLVGTEEIESEFSPEVAGGPLAVTPNLGKLPAVSRQQIVRDASLAIFRSQPQIATVPGSTTRDVFLDPFSTEVERERFILDFIHNASSFSTLLRIDDPGLSGASIPVAQSAYKLALKQAFFLRSTDAVQDMIDRMFEHRASNFGLTRREGRRARGSATFYLRRRPTVTITIPVGQRVSGGGRFFRTTSSARITPSGAGAFYNAATGRYSVTLFLQAEEPGISGNLTRGQVKAVVSGPPGVQVINESRLFGGQDQETNRELAARGIRVLSSADSGRLQGYVNTAIDVPGVSQVNVVDAGHSLMLRDLNPDTLAHDGGKVDIWVRGESLAQITDTFAFSFEIVRDVQFEPVGDPRALLFRAVDPNLSSDNPIIEMLDDSEIGLELRNTSTGEVFNLTNVQIVGFNQVQLDTSLNDPVSISLTDIIYGDYRYRTSNKHVFERQPVRSVFSFQGDPDRSGVISPLVYDLFHPSSPLDKGRSSEAGDYLRVTEPLTPTGGTIPSGDPIVVTGEGHVILDGIEYLDFLGANPITVKVLSLDRTIEYVGPFNPLVASGTNPDFTIIEGGVTTPLGILATSGSDIASGMSIIIDYRHDENFAVDYEVNGVVQVVQEDVDATRHITADVLVKEAIQVPVDLFGTAVLQKGTVAPTARSDLRTNLTNLFNSLILGEPIRQSDVIDVVDSTNGVSYVVVPLAHMARGDGATVVREAIPGDQTIDMFHVTGWSTPTVDVWLLLTPLSSATVNGGGPSNEFRGVSRNKSPLVNIDEAPNANGVPLRNAPGQSFIIGNTGLTIPGYSDDATLLSESPFATDEQIDDRRVEISANRVMITVTTGESPLDVDYAVTYIVATDVGVKNIEPGPLSYLVLGNLDFTFDEDEDFNAQVTGRA